MEKYNTADAKCIEEIKEGTAVCIENIKYRIETGKKLLDDNSSIENLKCYIQKEKEFLSNIKSEQLRLGDFYESLDKVYMESLGIGWLEFCDNIYKLEDIMYAVESSYWDRISDFSTQTEISDIVEEFCKKYSKKFTDTIFHFANKEQLQKAKWYEDCEIYANIPKHIEPYLICVKQRSGQDVSSSIAFTNKGLYCFYYMEMKHFFWKEFIGLNINKGSDGINIGGYDISFGILEDDDILKLLIKLQDTLREQTIQKNHSKIDSNQDIINIIKKNCGRYGNGLNWPAVHYFNKQNIKRIPYYNIYSKYARIPVDSEVYFLYATASGDRVVAITDLGVYCNLAHWKWDDLLNVKIRYENMGICIKTVAIYDIPKSISKKICNLLNDIIKELSDMAKIKNIITNNQNEESKNIEVSEKTEGLIFCCKCGKKIPIQAFFCTYCGEKNQYQQGKL